MLSPSLTLWVRLLMTENPDHIEYSNGTSSDISCTATSDQNTPDDAVTEIVEEVVKHDWPPETWQRAVQSFESDALWRWFQDDKRRPVLLNIARGFQVAQRVLRQALVRKRLAQLLAREHETAELFLTAWRETKTAQATISAVDNLADETAFHEQRQTLERIHGADTVFIAALLRGFSPDNSANRVLEVEPPASKIETETPKTDFEKKRLQEQIASLKTRLRERDAELSTAKKHAENLQRDTTRAQAERDQTIRQNQQREAELNAQHDATRVLLERLARKHRVLEASGEEFQSEIKRLQRIVRQSQKLNEESRRQAAQLSSQLAARDTRVPELEAQISTPRKTDAVPKTAPQIARPLVAKKITTPQEQVFVWDADGHEVRICPREVREAIDRNDESRVGRLVQELDALRESDDELRRKFLRAVRDINRYYSRVLTGATTRVLVDASNVARHEKDARGKGRLQTLLAMRDELRRHDFFPIVLVADASLPYNIDEPLELTKMTSRGEVEMTNVGVEADEILARESRRSGAYVVTNDRNFHRRVAPDWEPSRIGFSVRDGVIELGDW